MPSTRLASSSIAQTYSTTTGRTATIELPGGSRVTLAPRTTLTVVSDRGQHLRSASLVGEADFDIVPDPTAPFVVHTGRVTTRVLGTHFGIRRYADDLIGRIVVFSGKVATDSRSGPVTLTAGMVAQFTDSLVTATVSDDPSAYADWTNGRLVFRNATVPTVLATLKRWYGYEFRLADSTLATQHVTGVFAIVGTTEMMEAVKRVLGVTMTFDGHVITLQPERSSTSTTHPTHDREWIGTSQSEVGK